MKKVALVALGLAVGCATAHLVVHRRVVFAMIKGEPLPEPPEWHAWHTAYKK